MTTCIYVENVLGSGQVITLIEDFGDYSVRRNLQPGENARLIVSPFKSIWVQELPFVEAASAPRTECSSPGAPDRLRLVAERTCPPPGAGGRQLAAHVS
jgi:hypothetical protein